MEKMTESEYKKTVLEQADKVKTKEDLLKLLDEIAAYPHDYGTIVMGCLGAMSGAFSLLNSSPNGSITGFQASCLAHELFQKFSTIKPPYRILDLNKMLYPQYESHFQKTMDKETFEGLQKKAKECLQEDHKLAHTDVLAHWKKLVAGEVPFGWEIK